MEESPGYPEKKDPRQKGYASVLCRQGREVGDLGAPMSHLVSEAIGGEKWKVSGCLCQG